MTSEEDYNKEIQRCNTAIGVLKERIRELETDLRHVRTDLTKNAIIIDRYEQIIDHLLGEI